MLDFILDHVVIAVRDLDAATADYSAIFGREPSWRGEHPAYGTRNTLYRIDNTYIELLALGGPSAKKKDGRWAGELSRFLERGEGVYALALGTADVNSTVRTLRDRGLDVQDPADGSGIDAISGGQRFWRNAMAPVRSTNGARVFFIEHKSPPDALPIAAVTAVSAGAFVKRMDHAVVLSADMESAKHVWADTFDARLALDRTFPDRSTRILFFRLGDITIEFSGGSIQTEEGVGKPDRLWGLAWGVDDLDAMCARLRDAGIDVSEPRKGIKPGTRVATVKGERAHGVATLLIEHAPESFQPEARLPQNDAFDNRTDRRAFHVTGLDSVTVSTTDADAAAATWASTLGLRASDTLEPSMQALKLMKLSAGNAFIELAQAFKPEHRLAETIAERGQGMYAIALEVDDIDAAVRDLRAKGVLVSDTEYGLWPGTRVARINKAATNGVQLQLVQRLPDVL
jgi:catechol 2,3-dioxygenase-like lactoylglutathione lyase family enzyme